MSVMRESRLRENIADRLVFVGKHRQLKSTAYVTRDSYPLYDSNAVEPVGGWQHEDIPQVTVHFYRAPALFLDLDGTVRGSASGKEFYEGVADIGIYPNVVEKITAYRELGFLILGITNQGGVAHGHKNLEDVYAESRETDYLTGNLFDIIYACPCHENGMIFPFGIRSPGRKPAYGMLAVLEFLCYQHLNCQVDWNRSILVGDRAEDKNCAGAFGLPYVPAQEFFASIDTPEAPKPPQRGK